MKYLVLIIEVGILLLIVLLGFYDWFYTYGIRRMTDEWGIIFPPIIKKLTILNLRITLLAIGIVLLLILYTLYTYIGSDS